MNDETAVMLRALFLVCVEDASKSGALIPQPAGAIVAKWYETHQQQHGREPSTYLLLLIIAHLLDAHLPINQPYSKEN